MYSAPSGSCSAATALSAPSHAAMGRPRGRAASVAGRAEPCPESGRPVFPASAIGAGAEGRLAFGGRRVSPANHLWQVADAVNLIRRDETRDDHLPSSAIFRRRELGRCFGGG